MGSPQDIEFENHNAEVRRMRAARDRLDAMHPREGLCGHCDQRAPCDVRLMLTMGESYENGITWMTTCLNCARLYNDNYAQYEMIEALKKLLVAYVSDETDRFMQMVRDFPKDIQLEYMATNQRRKAAVLLGDTLAKQLMLPNPKKFPPRPQ